MDEFVQTDASDGFVLIPHITPGGLDDFADTVVPLLQERGSFRTEYTGTAWIDGRDEAAGLTLKRIGQPGMILPGKDVTFFVPDCLPYVREGLERAQLTVNMAMQASGDTGAIHSALGSARTGCAEAI